MWKVSYFYEKVHDLANFGGYATILLVLFSDRGTIIKHVPSCFKPCCVKAVYIIDCSEVLIQCPTCLTATQ